MNPVFLSGDEVTFSTNLMTDSGVVCNVTVESLVTEYGFFVPFDNDSFFILEFLRNGPIGKSLPYPMTRGMFIRSDGSVIIYAVTCRALNKDKIAKAKKRKENQVVVFAENYNILVEESMPVHYGPGNRRAFGCIKEVERKAAFALMLADDIPHVIDAYMKTSKIQTAKYIMLKIPEVVKYLQENKPSINFTQQWEVTLG